MLKSAIVAVKKKNDLSSEILFLVGDEDQVQSPSVTASETKTYRKSTAKETPVPIRAKVEKTPSFKDALSKIDSIGKVKEPSSQFDSSSSENQVSEKLVNSFDQTELDDCWTIFFEKLKKKDIRMYSALKAIQPTVGGNHTVEISFQNNAQVEEFQTRLKPSLTSQLRESLKNELIEVIVSVANSEKINKPTLLNDKERLDNMIEKNPALLQLKNKFRLDFE